MNDLFQQLKAVTDLPHGWTSYEKAKAMASAVIALRPAISVEIGVYAAKGLTSLALAHKEIGGGIAIGIDPYSAEASVEGQTDEAHRDWWSKLNYESIFKIANDTLNQFEVGPFARIVRQKSQEAEVPQGIGVIRVDGNHGEAVLSDIRRFTPACVLGAILFLDDMEWPGMSVKQAADELEKSGWRKLYNIDDGAAYQRVKPHKEKK